MLIRDPAEEEHGVFDRQMFTLCLSVLLRVCGVSAEFIPSTKM